MEPANALQTIQRVNEDIDLQLTNKENEDYKKNEENKEDEKSKEAEENKEAEDNKEDEKNKEDEENKVNEENKGSAVVVPVGCPEHMIQKENFFKRAIKSIAKFTIEFGFIVSPQLPINMDKIKNRIIKKIDNKQKIPNNEGKFLNK